MRALIGHEIATDRPDFAKFPVNFPVSREFGAETSSQLTASSATQSVSSAQYDLTSRWGAIPPFARASAHTRHSNRARPRFSRRLYRCSNPTSPSVRLSLRSIRPSIGIENPIPEEMDHREIAVRVPVMNEMQFLFPSEPCKSLKPRSLYMVLLIEKDVCVERRRTRD